MFYKVIFNQIDKFSTVTPPLFYWSGSMKTPYSQPIIKQPLAGSALKAAAFFSAGIFSSAQFPLPFVISGIILGVLLSLTLLFSGKKSFGDILACLTLLCAGMFAYSAQNDLHQPLRVPPEFKYTPVKVEGTLRGDARIQSGNTVFTLSCKKISTDSAAVCSAGLLSCVLYNKSLFLTDGSGVVLRGSIKNTRFPFEPSKRYHVPGKTRFPVRLNIDPSPSAIIIAEKGGFFSSIRTSLLNCMDSYDFMGQNALLHALTIGDLRGISPETRAEFTRTGIAHLLAVSGMNVGVLALVMNFLLAFLPMAKRVRTLILIILLFLYTGICGFQPPVSRAFIMAAILMGAQSFERPPRMEHTLFLALLFILAFDPGALGGASLQLSFAAVWALITFYTPIMNFFRNTTLVSRYCKPVTALIVATLVCTAVTAPIVAVHFGCIPFLALPANIPAVPAASFITVLGMASTGLIALGILASPLAQLTVFITGFLLTFLAHIASYASRIPLASLTIGNISPLVGIGILSWLAILSRSKGRPAFQKALVYIPLILMAVATWVPAAQAFQEKGTGKAVFLDVGQGDAALVSFPGGQNFLVDTGPSYQNHTAAESMILPSLRNAGVARLDGVFITHMDSDHSGGLPVIMKNIPVKKLYCSYSTGDSLRKLYGDRVTCIGAGDSLSLPGGGALVISPGEFSSVSQNENNASLVIRFNLGADTILFTGDIENDMQHSLLPWGKALRAEVLKIPHHGAGGLDSDFVRTVDPKTGIISCGMHNRYRHPAQTTLSLLEGVHCTICRTDLEGNIVFRPPGHMTGSGNSFYYGYTR